MEKKAVGRLTAVGGDKRYQYALFTLEYGQLIVQIRIEIEDPQRFHVPKPTDEYRKLLYEVGVAALEIAKSPNALSWPALLKGHRDKV
jgi:hypothetical protein